MTNPKRNPKVTYSIEHLHFTGDAYEYTATNIGNIWTIKRYVNVVNNDDVSSYVEALIEVDTDDPAVAIKAAIERNSWA